MNWSEVGKKDFIIYHVHVYNKGKRKDNRFYYLKKKTFESEILGINFFANLPFNNYYIIAIYNPHCKL